MSEKTLLLTFGWYRNSRNRRAHYYKGDTLAACGTYAQASRPVAENRHTSSGPKCGGCLKALGK